MMKSLFEQSGGTYSDVGDYRLPNLSVLESPPAVFGKFTLLRQKNLKKHRRVLYINLLTAGKLNEHLMEIELAANNRMEQLVQQMETSQGITEQMKAENQMHWIGRMNNIQACANELVLNEVIYI